MDAKSYYNGYLPSTLIAASTVRFAKPISMSWETSGDVGDERPCKCFTLLPLLLDESFVKGTVIFEVCFTWAAKYWLTEIAAS